MPHRCSVRAPSSACSSRPRYVCRHVCVCTSEIYYIHRRWCAAGIGIWYGICIYRRWYISGWTRRAGPRARPPLTWLARRPASRWARCCSRRCFWPPAASWPVRASTLQFGCCHSCRVPTCLIAADPAVSCDMAIRMNSMESCNTPSPQVGGTVS